MVEQSAYNAPVVGSTPTPPTNETWYVNLIDDCKDIVVETEFTSRWVLVEGYHQLGSRILAEYENFQRLRMPDSELVQRIAISIGRSDRTVYYAIQFARMYPDLNLLPEGKNISWHHIVNKYLTDGSDKPTVKKADLAKMIKEIKQLLQHEWEKVQQEKVMVIAGKSSIPKDDRLLDKAEFIRYLQDQVNKITGGVE